MRCFSNEFRDFARPVGAFTQLRESPHVLTLRRSDAIESDSKKLMIEFPQGELGCLACHADVDTFIGRQIPSPISPFLKEVRISTRLLVDFLEGIIGHAGTLLLDGATHNLV